MQTKPYAVLSILLLLGLVSSCSGQPKSHSTEVEEQIRLVENSLSGRFKFEGTSGDNLKDQMAFHKVKGLSIAVVKDYKVIWAKGYGWADENGNLPVTENTLFHAASVSKSVNSMGVMKLVQDKRLDLNKDINEYLVSWKFPYDEVSKGKKITTLNLLTHTSGISDGAPMYIDKDSLPSIVQVLNGSWPSAYIYSDPQPARSVTEPNLKYQYSNNAIGITQVMVSDITQKSYEQYMTETVFKPLGMTNSCYSEASLARRKGSVAVGYTNGYELPGKHVIVLLQAAGGLWTTPTDLARFIVEVQLSMLGKSNKVLTQETVKTMLTPYLTEAPGFFMKQMQPGGAKYFSHSGSTKGFKSEYFGSLEGGNGVVVMVNSDGASALIIPEVINSVATVYQWKDFYEPEIRKKPIAVSDELLDKCEGVYSFDDQYVVILRKQDGGHYWTDSHDSKMYFTGTKEFINGESLTNKELLMDTAGNVIAIKRYLKDNEITTATRVSNPMASTFTTTQLAEIGWYLLENREYKLSRDYFKHLLSINPNDWNTKFNLAHCFLFLKDSKAACTLYGMALRENENNPAVRQTIIDDFVFFSRNGFDTKFMNEAITYLKLEMPKELKVE